MASQPRTVRRKFDDAIKKHVDNLYDTPDYNLNDLNCTGLTVDMAESIGVEVPKTEGEWPGGGGLNPGDFGEDLRDLKNESKCP